MKSALFFSLLTGLSIGTTACAGSGHMHNNPSFAVEQTDAIKSAADKTKPASFDILAAHVHRTGNTVTFHMTTSGKAGANKPAPTGKTAGSNVWSYVWPTSLDPAVVGFDKGAGLLAMAATNHPDFDDTPLYDENLNGNPGDDGGTWHSHWVVLVPTEACGPGALAVKDIPDGTEPSLPATWPGLPILIDSPGFTPIFNGPEITINAAIKGGAAGASYDGVTSALRVNNNVHAPLLCVTDIFDVASGDLGLPGKVK